MQEQKEMEVRFLTMVVDIGLLNQRLLEQTREDARKKEQRENEVKFSTIEV